MLQAEEKYLVAPDASLGTWFARVQETICVACRVTLRRLDEGRQLGAADVASEQLGLQADICAEAVRAAAQIGPHAPSPEVRKEILGMVAERATAGPAIGLTDVLIALGRCVAALEPLANGLREQDLPMGDPTDREAVAECLLAVAGCSFGVIHALC